METEICVCGHPFELHATDGCVSDCYCYLGAYVVQETKAAKNEIRSFASGATRSSDIDKLDYEGFLSPFVLRRFARYMHANRRQVDGTLRPSDNWQKGLPPKETLKSLLRHVLDVWIHVREQEEEAATHGFQDALCAVLFNAQSLLLESIKAKGEK